MKLTANISDQDIASIPQTSGDSILNQMVTDLKKAEPGLPLSYGEKNTDRRRVTRYALNSLLARAATGSLISISGEHKRI